jgi:hypothetical protein
VAALVFATRTTPAVVVGLGENRRSFGPRPRGWGRSRFIHPKDCTRGQVLGGGEVDVGWGGYEIGGEVG